MHRTAATAALLAASTIALAQARYEIGYQFDDEPEVVRVESQPFFESVRRDPVPDGVSHQTLYIDNRTLGRTPSFNAMDAQIVTHGGGADARSIVMRSSITYDDLVFSSDEPGDIVVDLNFYSRGMAFVVPTGTEYAGIEYARKLTVELDDQVFSGEVVATLTGDRDVFTVSRTGILDDEAIPDLVLEDIVVPVNEPVTLRIEVVKRIRRPDGVSGRSMHLIARSPDTGFPFDMEVFVVPNGIRVGSVQAAIYNNRWTPCPADVDRDGSLYVLDFLLFQNLFDAGDPLADFDGDGELTIFDFLAFQNAFDAGCP
ncbi:hypothetical protein AY599_15045 [Leptolyngbya valderiana BDU 20041]|nr:hypothetical protein AY599_15045 [Leptolyngbya valderiana BDU 20041]